MNRRTLLRIAGAQIPVWMATLATAPITPANAALATGETELLLFDERFPHAAAHAARLAKDPDIAALLPTRGDATVFRQLLLHMTPAGTALHLAGVTTEAFHFCLQRLLRDQGSVRTTITRVDQDLHAWSLYCNNANRRAS